MKYAKILTFGLILFSLCLQSVRGQQVRENNYLRVTLYPPDQYSMLYVTDLINEPASAPIVFQINMEPLIDNPEIAIEVEFTADVPDLGLNNEQIFWVQSDPFVLKGNLNMNNRDLADRTNTIQTTGGPVTINAESDNIQYIEGGEQDQLINSILSRPTVPPGLYTLRYSIEFIEPNDQPPLNGSVAVEFESRPNVQLVAPADEAIIQTTYPVFQWESSGAARGCYYGIRVCEFTSQHSSVEEALNDDANLPFPSNVGEYFIPENADATSFQYPLTGAEEIQEGHQYVWQVQKYCPTTRGQEVVESEIFRFTVGSEQVDPVSLALQSILGQDQFDQYFGVGGELAGYSPEQGSITIDGQQVSMTRLINLSSQFSADQYTIINMQVQEQ